MQDGPDGSDPVIRKLFGVGLHKALKAEEGEEVVEVRRRLPAALEIQRQQRRGSG